MRTRIHDLSAQRQMADMNRDWHLRLRWMLFIVFCLLLGLTLSGQAWSQSQRPLVYVAKVEGTIDLGLAPYIERTLQEAKDNQAAAVVLQINTFGGRVDAAVQIRDALLRSPVNTIAFVDSRAISAGALISLAAKAIVMTPGGTLGAATPVQSSGTSTETASEKTISYVRKEFGATAEFRHRNPLIAQAMVDPDVEIPGLVQKGKLLTLTTKEALEYDIADASATTLGEALNALGLRDAQTVQTTPNWAENLVRFLTDPLISSLLVSVAMLGIILEIKTPGFGIAGLLGLSALALFMWGHWIVDLAGWEIILLLISGLILLGIEIFIIPGFGFIGLLGLIAIVAALVMSTTGQGATVQSLISALARLGASAVLAMLASLILLRFLPKTRLGRQIVLQTNLTAKHGFSSEPQQDHALLGLQGVAASTLRPAGIATIEGQRVDVVSNGEYINAGEAIQVTHVDGNRVVVKRLSATKAEQKQTLHTGED
ncbi:NfeD family protein [Orrella sp. 11846]|uniref:NfeD family protein n=1 Tax=Orrella sp. 11846 TaxID=3409913 RepID=UPI003B59EA7C